MPDVGRFIPGIRELEGPRPRDVALAELAAVQFGVVTSTRLAELGFSTSAISRMVASGRLVRLYRGVYAVGHDRLLVRGHWLAAVLACGEEAVLSHREGATLSDLRYCDRTRIDVTVPGRARHGQKGIQIHRVRHLHTDEMTEIDGIRVTTVARTLLDLCDVIHPGQVRRAFEKEERMQALDYRALRAVAEGAHGRHALKVFLPLIAEDHSTAARAKSDLEARFLDFIRERQLPMPVVNGVVGGYEVDIHWPGTKLIIELDSWAFHRSKRSFHGDRAKWLDLRSQDFDVLTVTDPLLKSQPSRIATAIRDVGLLVPGYREQNDPRQQP
jgi:very-short-patch-repair endonuclease